MENTPESSSRRYQRVVTSSERRSKRGGDDADKIKIATVDVRGYKQNEIKLKVEGDKLIVTGEHHLQGDEGFETSKFEKKFTIPEGVDAHTITSRVTQDGVLLIEAPRNRPKQVERLKALGSFGGELEIDERTFKVTLDVSTFKLDELIVKVFASELTVVAKQETESSGHRTTKQLTRHFVLPREIDMMTLRGKITADKQLVVEAEKYPPPPTEERILFLEREELNGTPQSPRSPQSPTSPQSPPPVVKEETKEETKEEEQTPEKKEEEEVKEEQENADKAVNGEATEEVKEEEEEKEGSGGDEEKEG